MWVTRVSTRLAVVQWASSDGGSPRLATRSTPPFFWACAFQPVPATPNANATIATVNRSEALCVMRHLLEVLGADLREMMPQRPLRHQRPRRHPDARNAAVRQSSVERTCQSLGIQLRALRLAALISLGGV